ncbi:MAG: hypothetical protein A2161_10850 [Candidatus Schekmanbacteria bacterium RBG_13_48_7]|uniref:Probable chemoreceptor glutamine deamidase CheD n=1 Tax=Candidatus Schekmanbacteria bacterium RBG_13_48_7 TaxID=1817878 RepID=A0A1F7RQI1_9BACT|nr:MAG: hypothetical protein A2161_10850 [Candidatus Schekmanbacteria bacterium RBG_13_48_7]
MKEKKVTLSQIVVAHVPTILKTSELGSCIAITLFDKQKKIGALGHILLPHEDTGNKKTLSNSGKFADSAIKKMVTKMQKAGCDLKQIRAKIIGGAMFFRSSGTADKNPENASIGRENVKTAKIILKQFGIPVIALDVGGDFGRRIEFDTDTGKVIVVTTKNGRKEI